MDLTVAARRLEPERRDRALADLSLGFLLDVVTLRVGPLSTREGLLLLAINQANIIPLTRDPQTRRRYATYTTPAPDAERRAVSINAVAASLGLPFETVRREVRQLERLGACAVTGQGVIVPESFLVAPGSLESFLQAAMRLRVFYDQLRAAGLLEALPASAFPDDRQPPLWPVARLLADYVLRGAELFMAETGDMVQALLLLGAMADGLRAPAGGALPVARLARRLGVPEETARRHASRLAEDGWCVRTPRGLVVSAEMLAGPRPQRLLRNNAANVRRLFAGLAERGVIAAWDRRG